eukprot:365704-Chlamydomonas_euryale.AAC.12
MTRSVSFSSGGENDLRGLRNFSSCQPGQRSASQHAKAGKSYFGNRTLRCQRPHFARLANAA